MKKVYQLRRLTFKHNPTPLKTRISQSSAKTQNEDKSFLRSEKTSFRRWLFYPVYNYYKFVTYLDISKMSNPWHQFCGLAY